MPVLKVVAPSNPADAKALLTASIRDDDPVLFLENLNLYNTKGELPDEEQTLELGTAPVAREGRCRRVPSTSSTLPFGEWRPLRSRRPMPSLLGKRRCPMRRISLGSSARLSMQSVSLLRSSS